MSNQLNKGVYFALVCYGIWGVFPLYWYPLNSFAIPVEQVMAHRVLWTAVFSLVLLLYYQQVGVVLSVFRQPKLVLSLLASSLFIGLNWLVYLWSIKNHYVLDASLGYFINPLLNVLCGFLFFRERLDRLQWMAVGCVFIGVLWLAVLAGHIPWVSLMLAVSFSMYALIKKLVAVDVLIGLVLETFLLLPLAVGYLWVSMQQGGLVWGELSILAQSVLIGAGVVTALPLLLFAASARKISLSLLGILQYISPSLQLLLGLAVFGEILDGNRLVGYMWVWLGVLVFLCATWHHRIKY